MKESKAIAVDEKMLCEQIVRGWLPLPKSVMPPPRPFFLWRTLPEPEPSDKSFMEMLSDSVKRHTEDIEGNVGVWFSGGIDSSVLLYLLVNTIGAERVVAYCLDFGYEDEVARAMLVAKEFNVKMVMEEFTLKNHLDLVSESILNLRMPTDFATQVVRIGKMGLEHGTKTVLSALGVDEIQGGYPAHVEVSDADFPKVEASLLWRGQSYYAWSQLAECPGLNVRFPFLDRQLIAYCRAMPRSMKCKGRETKILTRQVFKGILPDAAIEAGRVAGTKRGFTPLIHVWWEEGLGKWVDEMIAEVPMKYRMRTYSPITHAKQFVGGKANMWRRLRLATVPIFLSHLEEGKYGANFNFEVKEAKE
jgi:asparagine synthetase B (glutamine-hydrolysing)